MTTTPFDILCPQHLCFDNDGIITHIGPGLRSVISPAADQSLFNLLTILRPLGIFRFTHSFCPYGPRVKR